MQLALIILAFGFTTILAQTQPQCKCSDLNPCEDAEFKKGQDCLKNADCIKLLGGDAAKVGTCLDAKVTRNAAMQTCMKPTISTIGCKDADAPAQVPAGPSGPAGGGPGGATDPTGKYFECVAKCAAGDGCYKKLGCALQITQADDGKINGARQKCIEANGGPNRNPDQEDCKCLAAAGVQVNCG